MQTLAHFGDGGPGPWILFFPLFWALVIGGGLALFRRTGHGRRGPGRPAARDDNSPLTVLGHRFASGEIDEDEYWRRLSVLDEQFGRSGKG
ncbi:SHOCT domain-containing protein [Streptomyces sp. NPDC012461]|jgi:putative membrane protein|uniref:SHOCT domain-containing protein n=2 Tax=unclassified Streptomyces TaxID=2593676 RepID=A0A6G3QYQ1_9ACTN|nr:MULTISPECIES: SHOCT domain-containing protein [unclassified Streptomyces]MBM7088798.1 SHOCT domain-containing protein [Streptomyces sp. S12]NEA88334.1 SHOCT domain-containing protein [Streptomyces sp. SID14436]NEC81549.1 SHOCT domain-containing protein [Streptomyces sp. SID7958]